MSIDWLHREDTKRGPDEDLDLHLCLQLEAMSQLSPEEKQVSRTGSRGCCSGKLLISEANRGKSSLFAGARGHGAS